MGKNKVKRTEEYNEMSKVFFQEVPDLLFSGCKIFVAVPESTGINPQELAAAFKNGLAKMKARASQPNPREMLDMSITGMPSLIKSALEN